MWRFLAGAVSALLLVGAGFLFFGTRAAKDDPLIRAPKAIASSPLVAGDDISKSIGPPTATQRTREQKRFDRYDKNRDERITLAERLASRRKGFARLDKDGDGKLNFEEWSSKTIEKFNKADANRDGWLDRTEFATTRVKRKPKPKCSCSPVPTASDDD